MKKRFIFLLSLCLIFSLTLVACGGGEGGGGDDLPEECTHRDADDNGFCDECFEVFEDGREPADGVIYSETVFPAVIEKNGESAYVEKQARYLLDFLKENSGFSTSLLKDSGISFKKEIVIGDTSREVSATAKEMLLEKLAVKKAESGAPEDLAGYLIYSDGNAVAIVWTDFQLAETAIDYFCENYLKRTSLTLETGYAKSKFLSLSEYLSEREDEIMAAAWKKLEAAIPEEYREGVVDELKNLYTLYDYDAAAEWLASLYDPEVGGWYATLSAKNNVGYYPDIEQTYLALSFMGTMGMAEMFEGIWWDAIPKDILEKAALWIYGMQEEDGNFYNPQWPKEYVEENNFQLRVTRDWGSANSILAAAGIKPKYTGYFASEENLTGRLGTSTAVSVAKTLLASEMLKEYESVESFRAYIDGWEKELTRISDSARDNQFYVWGSYMQTAVQYMTPEMVDIAVDFFDKHQKASTGVWAEKVSYASTNAIHKIVSFYNKVGKEIKHADKMIETTVEILSYDADTHPAGNVCELYNVWSCFEYIYTNVRTASPGTAAEREARCTEMKNLLYSKVEEPIYETYRQVLKYKIGDGSFSTYVGHSHPGTGGCYTAVPNTFEGDLAGFLNAAYDMPHFILGALDLLDYEIPYFTEEDRLVFIDGLYNQQESGVTSDALTHTFEDTAIGSVPEEITVSLDRGKVANSGAYIKVASDGEGNVLEFNSTPATATNGRNYNAQIGANHEHKYSTIAVLSFRMKVNEAKTTGSVLNLLFRATYLDTPVLSPSVCVDADGSVYFADSTGKKLGDLGRVGEYFEFTLVYDWLGKEYSVYSGDRLVGTSSASYSGSAKHQLVGTLVMSSNSNTDANCYIDNLKFYTYKPENAN